MSYCVSACPANFSQVYNGVCYKSCASGQSFIASSLKCVPNRQQEQQTTIIVVTTVVGVVVIAAIVIVAYVVTQQKRKRKVRSLTDKSVNYYAKQIQKQIQSGGKKKANSRRSVKKVVVPNAENQGAAFAGQDAPLEMKPPKQKKNKKKIDFRAERDGQPWQI